MKKLEYPKSIINVFTISVVFFLIHKAVRYPLKDEISEEIGLIELIFTHKEFPDLTTAILVMAIYILLAAFVFYWVRKTLLANRFRILTYLFFFLWAVWGIIEIHHLGKPFVFGRVITFCFIVLASGVLPVLLLLHAFGVKVFMEK